MGEMVVIGYGDVVWVVGMLAMLCLCFGVVIGLSADSLVDDEIGLLLFFLLFLVIFMVNLKSWSILAIFILLLQQRKMLKFFQNTIVITMVFSEYLWKVDLIGCITEYLPENSSENGVMVWTWSRFRLYTKI